MTLASRGYHQLFQRLYQEGYALQSTITAPRGPVAAYHTLLFVKTQ
ncbi:MAG: hypothetical protein WKG07_03180 [Hymenobacter sp.]